MATGRPHLLLGGAMRRLLFLAVFLLLPSDAFAIGALACVKLADNRSRCSISYAATTQEEARAEALQLCHREGQTCSLTSDYADECIAVAHLPNISVIAGRGRTIEAARRAVCASHGPECEVFLTGCDPHEPSTTYINALEFLDAMSFGAVGNGISFGIGLLVVLLMYAKRGVITNHVIHGNLPYKLETYGDDIRCVFKRTQRVNWYGRVIFGIAATLVTTGDQLTDVRKYWLGRVVAFDSLRRQRQNELAKMHLQLAKSVQSEAKDTKPLSQLLAALKFFFFVIFYLIRALFSFLFGFLFIRVTIARLVRGTVIESKDLTLVLQAKEAIEQSATYLKEYLTTANTFDGRGEVV